MKKRHILLGAAVVFLVLTDLCIVSAIFVTGTGFIDFSSLARGIAIFFATIFALLTAFSALRAYKTK